MAFNPFHRFRKHQKAFFAVLTIICMFVFVLQIGFGKADPLNRLMDLFGIHKQRGEYVTTLNGVKFYESDLEKLSKHRQIADDLLRKIADHAAVATYKKVEDQVKAAKPESRAMILPTILDHIRRRGETAAKDRADQIKGDLSMLALEKTQKPQDARLYDALAAALKYEFWFFNPDRPRNSLYFGGTRDPEDLLDFAMWKQQSDRLGIVLNLTDLRKAINADVGQPDLLPLAGTWKEDDKLLGVFRNYRNLTEDELTELLTDEFRVLMAQEVLLGEPAANRGPLEAFDSLDRSPVAFTPLEYLQYFRENRTTIKAALLDVPVANFISKVTETPSEKELERLYNKYKEFEPTPESDVPGFKVPRKVRVEYISVRADSPFYKEAARRQLIQGPLARLGGFANTYAAGGGAAWAVMPLALSIRKTPDSAAPDAGEPLERLYDSFKERYQSWLPPTSNERSIEIHENCFLQRDAVRSLFGGITATIGSGGFIPAAPASYLTGAFTYEIHDRLRAIPASVLAAGAAMTSLPTGAMIPPIAATSLALPYTPAPPSLVQMKPILLETALKATANEMMRENIFGVAVELAKLRNKNEEARKYIDKTVKEFGLTIRSMTEAKDRFGLANDPNLTVLKEAHAKASALVPNALDFVPGLLAGKGTYEPLAFSAESGFVRERQGEFMWRLAAEEPFLIWRTEDKPEHTREFDQARADVVAAWKLLEAQRFARKEADRIDAEVRQRNSPVDAVKFLREQKQGPVSELTNVALLIPSISPGRYQPYIVPKAIVAHPRANFVETLMRLRKPGESIVLRDRPEEHYYVAVLQERSEPNIDREFVESYEKTPFRESEMQQKLLAQRRRQFRNQFMAQLRREAGPVDDSGRFKIPENLNIRKTENVEEE